MLNAPIFAMTKPAGFQLVRCGIFTWRSRKGESLSGLTLMRHPDGRYLVVVSELAENPGTSITNDPEAVIAHVLKTYLEGVEPARMLFLEHYRDSLSYSTGSGQQDDRFDQWLVQWSGGVARHVSWRSVRRLEDMVWPPA